jgi:hypothetical protein
MIILSGADLRFLMIKRQRIGQTFEQLALSQYSSGTMAQSHMPIAQRASASPSRGTVNDRDPSPPPGLSPSEALRWITGRRHLTAAEHTDINALDEAGRARHFGRLRATVDDLLHLCGDLSKHREQPHDGPSDML